MRTVWLLCVVLATLVMMTEARRGLWRKNSKGQTLFGGKPVDRKKEVQNGKAKTDSRQGKLFSLFSIVQFKQDQCTTQSDSTMFGTCMTTNECSSAGGTADGNCAAGFGVCCMFIAKCGTTTSVTRNCTYLQNSEFPSSASASSTCSYTFNRICDNLCQIRLDFDNFVSASPPTTGANTGSCATGTDFLTVTSPTGASPPVVCGTLTGQHMYLETSASGTAGSAVFTYGTATTTTRTYKVKVTYYTCDSPRRAPAGCVQYFTGASGNVQSYNFQGGVMLTGQNYNNCFRQELGFCTINYNQNSGTSPDPFDLYGTIATNANGGAETTSCPTTFVMIPTTTVAMNRICGGIFSTIDGATVAQTVTGTISPFELGVFQSATATTAAGTLRGFNLDYTQVPCS